MTTSEQRTPKTAWYSETTHDVAPELGVDLDQGLDAGDVEQRLDQSVESLTQFPSPTPSG
jgi:hypothetical protein